jgi:predicted  nucleic acid-binding Zn-ribbon protein
MANYSSSTTTVPEQGMYVGFVKEVVDSKRAGRLKVWIPEFKGRENDPAAWIICNYCSPFGGSTSWRDISETEFDNFAKTQQSYGFWAVPPDKDNEVLVVFPNRDLSRAVWIGSIFKEYMNHMVPGIASSNKNKNMNGTDLPVAEYNKFDRVSGDTAKPLDPVRPWHRTRSEAIGYQGLIKDKVRGTTTSSAQRESPSQVYGMNTPGPLHPTDNKSRLGGSSFVMDDGVDSEYIGFRTRSGAQIKIDETHGIIYAINKKGTSWIQMDEDGNVDIFSAESISARSRKDINFRADRDINIEAGQNINVKAAMDTDSELAYVGEGAGVGGDIKVQALNNHHTTVEKNQFHRIVNGNYDSTLATGNSTTNIAGTASNTVVGDTKNQYNASFETLLTDADGKYAIAVAGNMSTKASGTIKIQADGAYNLKSLALQISAGGDIDSNGNFIAGGEMFSSDFKSPTVGLNDHTHKHLVFASPTSHSDDVKAPESGTGGSNSANGADADTVVGPGMPVLAEIKEMIDKTDVLSTFPTTSITANGGKNIEIPDWWNRDILDVKTTVERLITFEPCPEHIKKGE